MYVPLIFEYDVLFEGRLESLESWCKEENRLANN